MDAKDRKKLMKISNQLDDLCTECQDALEGGECSFYLLENMLDGVADALVRIDTLIEGE